MDKRYFNIFRKLKEYFVSPGLILWVRIRNRLFMADFPQDKILSLKDYEVAPPESFYEKIFENIQQHHIKNKFEKLADYEADVPEGYFENILLLIKNRKKSTAIIARMPGYQKIIAAACFIGLISGLYLLIGNKNNYGISNEMENNGMPSVSIDSISVKTDSALLVKASSGKKNTVKANKRVLTGSYERVMRNITIEGIEIPVENNEILYSFIKFSNARNVNWNNRKKIIQVNDYAGISVSPYISKVIEDLYKTKKNGKRTAKAWKAVSKIKRWRRADIKTFDKKKNRNPLDIIDLGDNVY